MTAGTRSEQTDVVTLDDEIRRIEALLRTDGRADATNGSVVTGGHPGEDVPAPPHRTPRLARLVDVFGLSSFEADLLLLAAAVELDGRVAHLVAGMTGGDDALDPRPTLGLALATLPGGHWDAASPIGPLRHWQVLTLAPGPTLTTRRIAIDEQVLHALAGTDGGLGELDGTLVDAGDVPALAPSHDRLADEAAATLALGPSSLVRVVADDDRTATDVACTIAARLGRHPVLVRTAGLPETGPALATTARLIDRHCVLHARLPVLLGDHRTLVEQLTTPVVLTTADGAPTRGRTELRWPVEHVGAPERTRLWWAALSWDPDDATRRVAVEAVATHHRFDAATIAAVGAEVRGHGGGPQQLRDACRLRGRVALDGLAERVDARAGWDDIVLPDGGERLLRAVVDAVHHRPVVHDRWGFAARSARGLGVTALFAGDSGTGKTMAAEVLATSLDVDLFRIDLATVVDKYIGETEKHLARLFDAAERSGAVLLFDEADALFGKRGEVKEAHDRYANLEVSYLLQRMETYRGLAVLTTNMRSNVDRAFLRRLRFVVEFPFPDEQLRARIWARAFPAATPTTGIDPVALARLRVAGGSIRAIALTAAVAAAADGTAVHPEHVLHAAQIEYAKSDRALSRAETLAVIGGAG